jgi:parvulin-like peptidyl-prolyl isomerase
MTALLVSILLTSFTPLEKVVAVVNDSPILHSEVVEAVVFAGYDLSGEYAIDSATPEYQAALEELVENQLILNAAIDAGYYPTTEEIDELVDEYLLTDPSAYDADIDLLRRLIAENQASQVFIGRKAQSAFQDVPMSPETYLDANAGLVEEMIMPRHIGWIYLPILPLGPDHDLVMEEMLELRAMLEAGVSFEELAMEYSEDGSAMNGGYLGRFGLAEMTYEFEYEAFSLEEGEISQPITSPYGIHIIKQDARHDDGTIEASHILMTLSIDESDIERTIAQADRILSDIRAYNISFEDAARLYSRELSSSSEGGDMGIIPIKLWQPEIADIIEDLEIGSCSEPVFLEDSKGVAIFKLFEGTGEVDWESYSETELNGLVQQVVYLDTYTSMIDSLKNEMPVIYYLEDDGSSAD